jgi:hypothetical protein
MMFTTKDWAAMGYVILAVLSCMMLLFSGAAWGIWAMICLIKTKKNPDPFGEM